MFVFLTALCLTSPNCNDLPNFYPYNAYWSSYSAYAPYSWNSAYDSYGAYGSYGGFGACGCYGGFGGYGAYDPFFTFGCHVANGCAGWAPPGCYGPAPIVDCPVLPAPA